MFHLHLDIDRLRYMMLRITPVGMTERSDCGNLNLHAGRTVYFLRRASRGDGMKSEVTRHRSHPQKWRFESAPECVTITSEKQRWKHHIVDRNVGLMKLV